MVFKNAALLEVVFDAVVEVETEEEIGQIINRADDGSVLVYTTPEGNTRRWDVRCENITSSMRGLLIEFFRHGATNYYQSSFQWTPNSDTASGTPNTDDENWNGYFTVRLEKQWSDRLVGINRHNMVFHLVEA